VLSGCNVERHQIIRAAGERHTLEGTHADGQHCSALQREEFLHYTFPPVPFRSMGTFLWDSTLASVGRETTQERTDHSNEKRSEQYLAVRHLVEIFVGHVDLKRVHTCSKTKFKGVAM